jgi:hypothetical protein
MSYHTLFYWLNQILWPVCLSISLSALVGFKHWLFSLSLPAFLPARLPPSLPSYLPCHLLARLTVNLPEFLMFF